MAAKTRIIPELVKRLDLAERALERIASNEAFGSAGILGQGWAENEARQRMRVAREYLEEQGLWARSAG